MAAYAPDVPTKAQLLQDQQNTPAEANALRALSEKAGVTLPEFSPKVNAQTEK